jgi:hypothetical protein
MGFSTTAPSISQAFEAQLVAATFSSRRTRVAVLIPCYNEELTIGQQVRDFRSVLPQAEIYVYDNNSTDETVARARQAGAVVRSSRLQGKGNTVRLMFADIDADAYLLVDGDGTYDPAAAPLLVHALVHNNLDMVSAARDARHDGGAYRPGHAFGNRLLTGLISLTFGRRFRDILSGYRVFSRRFVKSFPAVSAGFEIETELTVHVLQMRLPSAEYSAFYRSRPEGSQSKLNTIRDGARILRMIGLLLREERPMQVFGYLAAILFATGVLLGSPILTTYMRTGLVPRLPTLVVSVGMMMTAMLSLACGLILDAVARLRLEQRRLAYLAAGRDVSSAQEAAQ